jgi:hypothetical protein
MICGSMICRAAIRVPSGVAGDGVISRVAIATALLGLSGRHVAVTPSRLLSFVPTWRPAAGCAMLVTVSVPVAISVFVAIVEFRFGLVAVITMAFVFGESGSRNHSNGD